MLASCARGAMLRSRSMLSLSGAYIPDDADLVPADVGDSGPVSAPHEPWRVAALAFAALLCLLFYHEATAHVLARFRYPFFVVYTQAVSMFIVHGVAGEFSAAVDRYHFDVGLLSLRTVVITHALVGTPTIICICGG